MITIFKPKFQRLTKILSLSTFFCLVTTQISLADMNQKNKDIALVIHGGAGTLLKKDMTVQKEKAYKEILEKALLKGYKVLKKGGTSLDAVEETVKVMENSPLFNAGKGAVFTHEGTNEMDASIMYSKTFRAGAVGGVKTIKNPISAARLVMEKSPHVMMTGDGADIFAKSMGAEIVDSNYFYTKKRMEQLNRIKDSEKVELDHDGDKNKKQSNRYLEKLKKFGTVGAVALDSFGDLAAATSTGGMTNKKFGRVGDSPIIGAGTYANDTCAVSATGHGEYFIRSVVAYDIAALMNYRKLSLQEASNEVVMKKLVKLGGEGGIVALDKKGNVSMTFNTEGMYRGYVKTDGTVHVFIYK